MDSRRYTAFISYRHTKPDEAVAKKLHTLIENYRIPADVKKSSGRRKMGLVFRDHEELPLSTDLGNDIQTALRESEWLIVLCSPSYLQSRWCMTEIDSFIKLGKRDHILALLVDGEPSEAFPAQLTYIETEAGRIEVEPLAGDVRGATLSAALKKLKREKLRLLAPMLNVSYDTLRQRARKRRARFISALTVAALLLLSGFLTYALVKNAEITRKNEAIEAQNKEISAQNIEISNQRDEILKQKDEIVSRHMQTLIEQANTSVLTGNKLPAEKLLYEASEFRSSIGNENDAPLYSALESAVHTSAFEIVQTVDNDNRAFSSIVFSHDDRYLLGITNKNSAALIDAESGEFLYTVSRNDIGQLDSAGFTLDDKYFFTVDSWYGYVTLYKTATGKFYREFNAYNGTAWNIGDHVFALSGSRILVVLPDCLCIWDYEADTGEDILSVSENFADYYTRPLKIDLSPDGTKIAAGCSAYGSGPRILSLDGSYELLLENDSQRGYYPIHFSGDGRYAAAVSEGLYFVWDAETGKLLYSGETDTHYHVFSDARLNYDGSVLLFEEDFYLCAVSVKTGKILWEMTTESNVATDAVISPNGKYVAADGGISGIFDIFTGERLSDLPCTAFSHDGSKVLAGTNTSSPSLLITPENATSRVEGAFKGELFATPRYTNPSSSPFITIRHSVGDIYKTVTGGANRKTAVYISPDTHYLTYTHEDGFMEVFDITDPEKPLPAYCIAEHCDNSVEDVVFNGSLMASSGGFDPRCAVFDLEAGTMLHVFRGEEYLHLAEFSEDGSKLILLTGLYKNVALVYSVQNANLLYRFDAPEGTSFTEIGFTTDGKCAVAKLSDGRAYIGEIYSSIEEMIEKAGE